MNTLFAQNHRWVCNNEIVNYAVNQTHPLPTSNNPDHSQNGLFSSDGTLQLYMEDGAIRDASGNLIVQQLEPNPQIPPGDIAPGFSECTFVPVPETCDEYYAISSFSYGASKVDHYLVYSRLKKTGATWVGQILSNGTTTDYFYNTDCSWSRDGGTEPDTEIKPIYNNHIAVTKVNDEGNRYLFLNIFYCIGVFEIRNDDIHFIGNSPEFEWSYFQANNRSEMEVYEYGPAPEGRRYTVATSYFTKPLSYSNEGGAIHIFEFIINGANVSFNYEYQVEIPKDPAYNQYKQCVNGLEFSEDGLTLYATRLQYKDNPPIYIDDKNLVYFSRPTTANNFYYTGVILSGSGTHDFAFGQIERGTDGKLYVAGDGRLGALNDNNNPNSYFNLSAVILNNRLTRGNEYLTYSPIPIYTKSVASMWLYLLPDQIDGEDYTMWEFGVPDLYPDTIYQCEFPYNMNFGGFYYTLYSYLSQPGQWNNAFTNNITLEGDGIVRISNKADMSCYEEVVVICCTEPGTETLCGPHFLQSGVANGTTINLNFETCTLDVPPPCEVRWVISYFNPVTGSPTTVTVFGTPNSYAIPDTPWNRDNATIKLIKKFCIPENCGSDYEMEWEFTIEYVAL
jgi:hypothetical protein